MLDLKYVRQHRDEVAQNIKHRKASANLDEILRLDDRRLELIGQIDSQRQELKASSKAKPDAAKIAELRALGEQIQSQETELTEVEAQLKAAAALLPNTSAEVMPIGAGEDDNVEVVAWTPGDGYLDKEKLGTGNHSAQYMPALKFDGQHHLELGEGLGIIDAKQGAKVSGSRFAYLADGAVLLENALAQFLAQELLQHEFIWVDPPLLVKEPVLFGTSHFPEGRDQVYQIATDNVEEGQELFLVGSSEPALFAYGMDRTFSAEQLPLKMFAVTPCFRSEVGSWGKDVRGIKRVHQFNKLEMDVICAPDDAQKIFEELRGYNEWLLQQLGLSYRVIHKCTGDCGYLATHDQYDVEVWMPSSQEFMETMTDTWATDYQARRLNIKYVTSDGSRELVHTVNNTGVALGRMVAAILDNFQQPDGSVMVPEALQRWVGTDRLTPGKLAAITR